MKPTTYSLQENQLSGASWKREGFNISYFKNNITKVFRYLITSTHDKLKRSALPMEDATIHWRLVIYSNMTKISSILLTATHTPTLTWTITSTNSFLIPRQASKVTFLISYRDILRFVTRKTLCKTLANNNCEYLTITSNRNFQVVNQKESSWQLLYRIFPIVWG